ncbi:hypothetical protein M0805_009491 [Coniferiporia weirii]|nr:hypothetical protein M0805_009491 [Coniferiporia weirii]
MNSSTTQSVRRLAGFVQRRASAPRSLPLLYADRGLIVLNKPSGLICQSDKTWLEEKGSKCPFDSLLEDLKWKLKLDAEPVQVHRLDKNTTGVLLLAKSSTHARTLFQQFQTHSIKKTYLAIVRGGRKSFPEHARGTINAALRVGPDKVHTDEDAGDTALTDWELLGSSDKVPLSLLRLSLHSGIKHQLRVHLASTLRVPILGDTLYSNKPPPQNILELIPQGVSVAVNRHPFRGPNAEGASAPPSTEREGRQRVFLHAAHVDVTRYRNAGPSKRLALGVTAPLPRDFLAVCDAAELTQFLTPEYISGGLRVDGDPVPLGEEIAGVEGRWLA